MEITEARHKTSSTIYCSQIDPSGWHLKLGNGTIAEAILDRIIHDSYQFLLDGEISMREEWSPFPRKLKEKLLKAYGKEPTPYKWTE